jgi:hypothetical protein
MVSAVPPSPRLVDANLLVPTRRLDLILGVAAAVEASQGGKQISRRGLSVTANDDVDFGAPSIQEAGAELQV